jgi:hypothetical protein
MPHVLALLATVLGPSEDGWRLLESKALGIRVRVPDGAAVRSAQAPGGFVGMAARHRDLEVWALLRADDTAAPLELEELGNGDLLAAGPSTSRASRARARSPAPSARLRLCRLTHVPARVSRQSAQASTTSGSAARAGDAAASVQPAIGGASPKRSLCAGEASAGAGG